KGVITMNTAAAAMALTNQECTPLGIHYAYDTYSLAVGTANPIIEAGGTKWFFITADYVFGHSLEASASDAVKAHGEQRVGALRAPVPNTALSCYRVLARGSGASLVGVSNAGLAFASAVAQAGEFGIGRDNQRLVGLLVFSSDVKSIGRKAAQRLQ